MIVLSGIVPTFAWRARAEEKLLSRTFGERYDVKIFRRVDPSRAAASHRLR